MKTQIILSFLIFTMSFSLAQGTWDSTFLSEAKSNMGCASLENKVVFGGGMNWNLNFISSKMEIYDVQTGEWTYSYLPVAKYNFRAVSSGSKVFFAEGEDTSFENVINPTIYVYDTQTDQWSTEQLSQPRRGMGIASVGNKVLFAGGYFFDDFNSATFDRVDIYDNETGDWSITYLSEPRADMGVTTTGNYVFFAGGWNPVTGLETNIVDIYNVITGNWSKSYLSEARAFIGATTAGNKVLFAGGAQSDIDWSTSNRVDIYDITNQTWKIDSLSYKRAFDPNQVASICDKAYFVSGECKNITGMASAMFCNFNIIDIYDVKSSAWKSYTLPHGLRGHSVLSVNDMLIIAGGQYGFWGIEFLDEVLLFTCSQTGVKQIITKKAYFDVFPNPTSNNFKLDLPEDFNYQNAIMTVYDLYGRAVMLKKGMDTAESHDISGMGNGIYFVELRQNDKVFRNKLLITR